MTWPTKRQRQWQKHLEKTQTNISMMTILWPHPCRIKGIWSFLHFLDTFWKRKNPKKILSEREKKSKKPKKILLSLLFEPVVWFQIQCNDVPDKSEYPTASLNKVVRIMGRRLSSGESLLHWNAPRRLFYVGKCHCLLNWCLAPFCCIQLMISPQHLASRPLPVDIQEILASSCPALIFCSNGNSVVYWYINQTIFLKRIFNLTRGTYILWIP